MKLTLTTIATLLAIIGGMFANWPRIGWEFPLAHATDIDALRTAIANEVAADGTARLAFDAQIDKLQKDVQKQIQWGQDRYECDRLADKLVDLRKQARLNPNDDEIQEKIRRIEQRMAHDGLDCARFDV